MRLFDFQCNTCDLKFEQMIDGDEMVVPCKRNACTGKASRMLGGHASFGRSAQPPGPDFGPGTKVGDFIHTPEGVAKVISHSQSICDHNHTHGVILAVPVEVGKA